MSARRFALLAAATACLATLGAMLPISRYLSKVGGDVATQLMTIFGEQSLPRLALGLAWVVLAIFLYSRRPRLAVGLLVATPVFVWVLNLVLIVSGR